MLLAVITLLACTGGDLSDDTGGDDTGSGDTGSGDTAGGDGGAATARAVIEVLGDAVVDAGSSAQSYAGNERVQLTADDGTLLCAIELALASVAPREDCSACLWAFDIEATSAEVQLDERCADADLGADALAATPRSYGYAEEYIGHSNALLFYLEGRWQGVAYASWDEASGALSYGWEQERVELP